MYLTCGLGEDSESDCDSFLVALALDELAGCCVGCVGAGVGAERVVDGGSRRGGGAPMGCCAVLRGGGERWRLEVGCRGRDLDRSVFLCRGIGALSSRLRLAVSCTGFSSWMGAGSGDSIGVGTS